MKKGFWVCFLGLWLLSDLQAEVIGRSVKGRKIEAFSYGQGKETILFIGGIHGDERQGVELLHRFRRVVAKSPSLLKGLRVVIVPSANPDGVKRGTRQNARGIDINRNFPTRGYTTNFQKQAYYPGARPASEPETRLLMNLIRRYKPSLVVTVHAQLHCMMVEGDAWDIARRMQYYNHYPLVDNLGYETPGSLGEYCGERGIPVITIEVPRIPVDDLWEQNREALRAVLLSSPGKMTREALLLAGKKTPSLLEALQRQDWYLWRDRFTNIAEWKKQDSMGNTALHYAIRRGDIPLALWLIDRDIHVTSANHQGWTPLFEAAYGGYGEVVRRLLDRGVSPEVADPYGWTPLIIAAQRGYKDIVAMLVEHGASVNAQDRYGYSALMEAVRRQHSSIVEYLLARGADPCQTNRYGQTASRQAILARSTNVLFLLGGQ